MNRVDASLVIELRDALREVTDARAQKLSRDLRLAQTMSTVSMYRPVPLPPNLLRAAERRVNDLLRYT
jgi:hypothetical protein